MEIIIISLTTPYIVAAHPYEIHDNIYKATIRFCRISYVNHNNIQINSVRICQIIHMPVILISIQTSLVWRRSGEILARRFYGFSIIYNRIEIRSYII